MADSFRKERDPLGELEVPADAYYGVQTQRAVENFPISGLRAPGDLIVATILIKKSAATSGSSRPTARSVPAADFLIRMVAPIRSPGARSPLKAAAETNLALGRLEPDVAAAI